MAEWQTRLAACGPIPDCELRPMLWRLVFKSIEVEADLERYDEIPLWSNMTVAYDKDRRPKTFVGALMEIIHRRISRRGRPRGMNLELKYHSAKEGEIVSIEECRPISKKKTWQVIEK